MSNVRRLMSIKRLEIAGFKSIDSIELTDLPNYCVFAGANGAGKSNFFDALKFASTSVDDGVDKALRQNGGHNSIRCAKSGIDGSQSFSFFCDVPLKNDCSQFTLDISNLGREPCLTELLEYEIYNEKQRRFFRRLADGKMETSDFGDATAVWGGATTKSMLSVFRSPSFVFWMRNCLVLRIDHRKAKEPSDRGADTQILDEDGHNLAAVLQRILAEDDHFDTIRDYMSLIVPGLEDFGFFLNRTDGTTNITFKESGISEPFSAPLISDGTIYVLCLLAAVLTRIKKPGLTMIEEPERGIHPQAIEQLSQFFREHASDEHQIFISTHNESFVRSAKAGELFFVVKEGGRTQFRLGRDVAGAVEGMPNDKAWLQNMFDGGLPW